MRYFEDLAVGYRSTVGQWRLEREEMIEIASRWDPQPFHVDDIAAEASPFGGLVASSLHLFAICTRLFFDHADRIQVAAMLGKDRIRLHAPARPGDVLTYTTECVEHRESRSQPHAGIVVLDDRLANGNDETVLTQQASLLVTRRHA